MWRGYDPDLETPVAVKVLAENWALDAEVHERFLAEAKLLRRIRHPAVVRVHDVGVSVINGISRPYLVMDHVTGGTLTDRVGTLSPSQAGDAVIRSAAAVQALHEAGVIHRDVKPSNLLIDDRDEVEQILVADLGSAKLLGEVSVLTMVAGTPAYMAPEQAVVAGRFDERVDVYALGVVAHQMFTGRLPDRARAPVPPIAREVGLPLAVDDVLATATATDPDDRFSSAAQFARALDDAMAGASPPVRVRHRPSRTWPAPAVALWALLLFLVSVAVTWRWV